ncbi:hypothetical protein [Roseobacter phage RDJL6]|nr:hypothetical protein [Roseobacter phage RDJL6]
MQTSIAEMKQQLRAQEAWGKWNTAPLANRIAQAEREAMSPARRLAQDVLAGSLEASVLVAGWALTLAPLVWTVRSWIF